MLQKQNLKLLETQKFEILSVLLKLKKLQLLKLLHQLKLLL
jgi:hypothetical protein